MNFPISKPGSYLRSGLLWGTKGEDKMKKTISIICILAFFNYIGCSSKEVMTKNSFIAENHVSGNSKDIYINTINDDYYYFPSGNYIIVNDSLSGTGRKILSDNEAFFKGKIALADISTVEQKTTSVGNTILLVLGISLIGLILAAAAFGAALGSATNHSCESVNTR